MSARVSTRTRSRSTTPTGFFGHLLDPIDRLSETIYSVLIVLTFTLAYAIIRPGAAAGMPVAPSYSDQLVLAALGAALAWGLIDGLMHALLELFQRAERHRLLRQIQLAGSEQEAVAVIADELDYVLEPIAGEAERHSLYRGVYAQLRGSSPRPAGFRREDFAGAVGCALVAVLAVLPSLAPLVLLRHDFELAIRASNVVSFIVLFFAGYRWGIHTGAQPLRTGLLLVAVAAVMVAIAIALGG